MEKKSRYTKPRTLLKVKRKKSDATSVCSIILPEYTGVLPTERVMRDDEVMFQGRNYILDGQVVRCPLRTTVEAVKQALGTRVVRRCDRVARALLKGMECLPDQGAGKFHSTYKASNPYGFRRGGAGSGR